MFLYKWPNQNRHMSSQRVVKPQMKVLRSVFNLTLKSSMGRDDSAKTGRRNSTKNWDGYFQARGPQSTWYSPSKWAWNSISSHDSPGCFSENLVNCFRWFSVTLTKFCEHFVSILWALSLLYWPVRTLVSVFKNFFVFLRWILSAHVIQFWKDRWTTFSNLWWQTQHTLSKLI